jgi:hypothetical protein
LWWLPQLVSHLPDVEPAGIIFHVSRCGSTLLSNALSAAENVLVTGEAPAIQKAIQLAANASPRVSSTGAGTLRAMCKAFAYYRASQAQQLIVKTGMATVIGLRAIRAIWPSVPCVMLVRDPIEVAVSNTQSPPKSILDWYDNPSACIAGAPPNQVLERGLEEFCAWLIGRTCEVALQQLDDKCILIDYTDLNAETALHVAKFFSVPMTADTIKILRNAFRLDAKHGGEFRPDGEVKKKAATPRLAEAVARWACGNYEALLRSDLRFPRRVMPSSDGK